MCRPTWLHGLRGNRTSMVHPSTVRRRARPDRRVVGRGRAALGLERDARRANRRGARGERWRSSRGGALMILVTGASGNVGSEVVAALAARGAAVRAVVREPARVSLPADVVAGDL